MINLDGIARENIKENIPNCSQIPDYPYWILITGGSGFWKYKYVASSNK